MKKIFALMVLVSLVGCSFPHDDTDPPNGTSGLNLYTDNLTGCQYLGHNGLTPRMGPDGKQICIPVRGAF